MSLFFSTSVLPAYSVKTHVAPPVAAWNLDEGFGAATIWESVGGLTGTYHGFPQKGVPGIVEGSTHSLGLTGWRDYVEIPHGAALALSDGTICGYCQVHALGWRQILVKKGILTVAVTGDGHLQAGLDSVTLESATDFEPDAGASFFFAFSWGADGAKVYLRRPGGTTQLVASDALATGMASETAPLYLGSLPASMSYDHQQRLFGFLSQVRVYDRQLSVADMDTMSAPVSAAVYDQAKPYWGWGLGQNAAGSAAANITMRGEAGFYFVALKTGLIDRVRLNLRQAEGYSLGDGGTYRIELCEHDPATDEPTNPLTMVSRWAPGTTNESRYEEVTVTTPRSTVRGRSYFVRFVNIAGEPDVNYSSLNSMSFARLENTDPTSFDLLREAQESLVGLTWFRGMVLPSMWEYRGAGHSANGFRRFRGMPMGFGVRYGSDSEWKQSSTGYGGRRNADVDDLYGSQRVAQINWTQPATKACDGIWLNLHKWGNAGALQVALKQSATTIETVSVPAAALSPGIDEFGDPTKSGQDGPIEWVFAPLTALRTLTQGTDYTVELRSPDSPDGSNCVILAGVLALTDYQPSWVMPSESWRATGGAGACRFSTDNGSSWVYFSHHGSGSHFRDPEVELPAGVRFVPEVAAT